MSSCCFGWPKSSSQIAPESQVFVRQANPAIAAQVRGLRGVADVYIPQDLDYPSLRISIDRMRASELGLTEKEVVSNIITALTSNQMIAPSIWIDPKSGNNYFLTRHVQGRPDQVD